ncbi:hypothetical protein PVK06_020527 [Gossypium arboreum]|uniref:Uncharacterized protein n=1 Tax=Gossypium arboreum TaxID=29729 RepID=A0ABR0PN46_GOSAR|nr:hypothetical protein PVK06_020527 [Gossypium arboreum]
MVDFMGDSDELWEMARCEVVNGYGKGGLRYGGWRGDGGARENGRRTRGSEEECFLFLFHGGGRARMLDDGRCWRWKAGCDVSVQLVGVQVPNCKL